jgi:ABC-type phosphate transport system permease subunit
MISCSAAYVVCTNIRSLARTHLVESGDITSNTITGIYSIVWGMAWWKIFRNKPALKQWAFAANLIIVFIFLPAVFWNWRAVLKQELQWWPSILFGVVGIIVFSFPYHGWRHTSQIPMENPSAHSTANE